MKAAPLLVWGGGPPFFILGLYLTERGTLPVPFNLGRLLPHPTLPWAPGEDENWLGDK